MLTRAAGPVDSHHQPEPPHDPPPEEPLPHELLPDELPPEDPLLEPLPDDPPPLFDVDQVLEPEDECHVLPPRAPEPLEDQLPPDDLPPPLQPLLLHWLQVELLPIGQACLFQPDHMDPDTQ